MGKYDILGTATRAKEKPAKKGRAATVKRQKEQIGAERATEARPEPPAESQDRKGPGRPPAKRSSAEYRQVTTFVRKTLYRKAQDILDEENDSRPKGATQKTFADVLESALEAWIKTR